MTRTYQPNLGITLEPTGPTLGSPWNPRAPAGARRSGKGPRRGGGSEGLESRGGLVVEALLRGGLAIEIPRLFQRFYQPKPCVSRAAGSPESSSGKSALAALDSPGWARGRRARGSFRP